MILDGKQVAQALTGELKEKTKSFARKPVLCIVRVGEDQSAISYCRGAKKRMENAELTVGNRCSRRKSTMLLSSLRFKN